MPIRQHIAGREACPFLPHAQRILTPSDSRQAREGDDPSCYYLAALTCAQSLWLQGKPAQALLQLNHALGVSPSPRRYRPHSVASALSGQSLDPLPVGMKKVLLATPCAIIST